MALWQIAGRAEHFDDGRTEVPGEEDFTADLVELEAAGAAFNYVGTPNWTPPVTSE